jgi:plasmid stabilization system protein ParE
MSARRPRLVLSPFAEDDFEDILAYTRGRWGIEQADTYAGTILAALEDLVRHSEIGRPRDDLQTGLRSYLIEPHHNILYRLERDVIRELRIVHVRTDPASWLRGL